MIDPQGLLFGILGWSLVNFLVQENVCTTGKPSFSIIFQKEKNFDLATETEENTFPWHVIGFGTESDFQKEKNCDLPEVGFRGKPTFQKEKNRYLKKIDSDKNFRGQFSVRNFRSYFINFSDRENFITKTILKYTKRAAEK